MPFSSAHAPLRHRLLLYPLVGALLLSLTGCLTFETFIKVKPDGSGTIKQTFILTSEMLRMALMFGGDDGGPAELCDEEELADEAAEMGEGVRLLSAEEINEDDAIGCHALFAFDNINTLNLSLNPENQMPAGMSDDESDDEAPDEEAASDLVTFSFDRGNPSTLVVRIDQDQAPDRDDPDASEAAPVDSTERDMQIRMMREMFKGARMAVILEVDGNLVETDASFHDGNQITLMDIDFDKLLDDEEYLEKIADANPQSADEMRALMEEGEGIMIETKEKFTVRFE